MSIQGKSLNLSCEHTSEVYIAVKLDSMHTVQVLVLHNYT